MGGLSGLTLTEMEGLGLGRLVRLHENIMELKERENEEIETLKSKVPK